ncbi:hypothetical protein [Parvibium lacunae]|uniref:HEPN AbiU2-like domain-containing protein n=1 Tax=Parvibium lacunae TaxID=1888893 RepID=A0A368L7S8_9BURK|nr:hypothetical protein [Parvibium lacunae]RCS59758.1 hypothetical protein DU000_03370 [Parvibium lacunae]
MQETSNPRLDINTAVALRDLCTSAIQTWTLLIELFDNNEYIDFFKQPRNEHFFHAIKTALHWQLITQISKLHDPATTKYKDKIFSNLSIPLIINKYTWDNQTKSQLLNIEKKMNDLDFTSSFKSARNKYSSHNDLEEILQDPYFAEFGKNNDNDYFEYLTEFMNIISKLILEEPYNSFICETKTDALDFIKTYKIGYQNRFHDTPHTSI